ncbi:unnamed protein product [Rhodiola kirilowii]
MGGTARFLMLLSSPYPFITPRPFFFLRLARNSRLLSSTLPLSNPNYSTRSPISFPPIRATQSSSFHSQSTSFKDDSFADQFSGGVASASAPNCYHPWPEWSRFIDSVRQAGYFERVDYSTADVDAWGFASADNFPSPEFLWAARACLEFARDRDNLLGYLSSSDIRAVVENGSAYLFRDADNSRSRMKSFLGIADTDVVEFNKATMVDLMKFLLSHSNIRPVSSSDGYNSNEQAVGSSVRTLLSELTNLNIGVRGSDYPASTQNHYPDRHGQVPRPRGQQIEMKRGDWICPKCAFMNFAKNTKCLECEEARPRRQLTNGEWECPQCDFFNYGRNIVCLRCDCKRPGEVTVSPAHLQSSNLNMSDAGIQLNANEKAQPWSGGNVSQLNNSSYPNQRVDDDEFPEIMPLRKGANRFVVSTRKTPFERRLANAQVQRDLGNEDVSGGINKSNNYGHVPFVPLPPDMFSPKPQVGLKEMGPNHDSHTSQSSTSPGSAFTTNEPDRPSEKLQLSERPVSLTEDRDNSEQAEKSERWFKRVAELHDVTDLASAISDEDFPELMPMRKGENRFVVSKKKDRSLTTPMHKRRATTEQPSESKFVPFVPFPPDYFAKKDQSQSDVTKSSQKRTDETSNSYDYSTNLSDKSSYGGTNNYTGANNRPSTLENSVQNGGTANKVNSEYAWSSNKTSGDVTHDFNDGYSVRSANTRTDSTSNFDGDNPKVNTTIKDWWSGKSLEGSAVKEIDPLDMSEEAKAERWFRRAAQIKDISELSQIPDEDFPSIMPMRKGVNRFVVSKRKTPLERRLTSPQYRRNLPVVDPDPPKPQNESN